MPTLPGKTLSQAHFDLVLDALPGTTAEEKTAAWDAWLTNHLISLVTNVRMARLDAEYESRIEEIRASLPAPKPFPPE